MDRLEAFAKNSEALRSFFAGWPSFHDAEVVEMHLWRGHLRPRQWEDISVLPVVTIKIRVSEATQPGAAGAGNDVLVTFR